jgi:MutS-like protein
MSLPAKDYAERLEQRRKTVAEEEALHIRTGNLKLVTIAAGLVLAWICLWRHLAAAWWLLFPVVVFIALAIWHELVLRAQARAKAAAAFYERGIARVEDRWAGTGEAGERFRDAKHVYAEDLDIFGRGGLFELLSTARTPMGEEWLVSWLLAASPVAVLRERHKLVAELREKLDLREDMAVLGESLRGELNPKGLASWAEAKGDALLGKAGLRWGAAALALAAVAAIIYWGMKDSVVPFLAILVLESGALVWLRRRAENVIESVGANAEGLILFSLVLKRIEAEKFSSARLQELHRALGGNGQAASKEIRKLAHITMWIDGRDGLAAKLAELPLLYTVQVAGAAEAWRRRCGKKVSAWINAAGEMEALLSFAGYAYEHPADPFPEFADAPRAQAMFEGEELGHPLIPAARCVRNTVRLGGDTRVLLVSGSNMSGKSTLLRTVGINTVLAMAGAPVRARSLRLAPLALGTRIRTTDSLQEGRSGFYTEILRIRDVFALTQKGMPLLYLLDELLEGTNSHDRCIGAEGLLRALVEQGAIGIITTHDLALTEVAASLNGAVLNAHFEDQIQHDEMHFDYKLRDGVVTKSNALELMRRMGLKV